MLLLNFGLPWLPINPMPIEGYDLTEMRQLDLKGKPILSEKTEELNYVFDLPSSRLNLACVTKKGVMYPPFQINMRTKIRK